MNENNGKPTFEQDEKNTSSIIHLDKKMEDAIKESKSDMSLEEQQAILNQIIRDVRRSQLLKKKKSAKMISPNHKKNKKAKKRMQNKSRKLNRK